jgi:hypothetical protein
VNNPLASTKPVAIFACGRDSIKEKKRKYEVNG